MRRILIVAAAALSVAGVSRAAELSSKQVLTLEGAMKMIAAAEAEASHNNWPCVVAVVDDGGWLIALQRMDAVPMLASVELAPAKARAAAAFRKPTQLLEEAINKGRIAETTAPGYTQMQGGVPVVVAGHVVGAIGVSADTPAHDQQIAEAGVRAITP